MSVVDANVDGAPISQPFPSTRKPPKELLDAGLDIYKSNDVLRQTQ